MIDAPFGALNTRDDVRALVIRLEAERELVCIAQHLPTGVDLRLLEGDDFRRTHLCPDAPAARALAETWRAALTDVGWTVIAVSTERRSREIVLGRTRLPNLNESASRELPVISCLRLARPVRDLLCSDPYG